MPAYDATMFDPPAPVARVTLRNPENGSVVSDVPMLMDSGADVSLLPQAPVSQIGVAALPGANYDLMAFDGTTSSASAVRAELLFLSRAFRGRFLLIDQACGIMGRDILNHLLLLFDGPGLTWDDRSSGGG